MALFSFLYRISVINCIPGRVVILVRISPFLSAISVFMIGSVLIKIVFFEKDIWLCFIGTPIMDSQISAMSSFFAFSVLVSPLKRVRRLVSLIILSGQRHCEVCKRSITKTMNNRRFIGTIKQQHNTIFLYNRETVK